MEKIIRENVDCTIRVIEIDGETYKLEDDNTHNELYYENRNDAFKKYGYLTRNLR